MGVMGEVASGRRNLIVIEGQEGTGKSTIIRALLRVTPGGAQLDAEDVGQVNPFTFDEPFLELLWDNVAAVADNFWDAGYTTVISGSFLRGYPDLPRFRERLGIEPVVYVVQLCASKAVRDARRIQRAKPSTREWREQVDRIAPEDRSFAEAVGDYRYLRVDDDELSVDETVAIIQRALPEIYGS
jgi:hypothetical protein